jgi:hypothetical protein
MANACPANAGRGGGPPLGHPSVGAVRPAATATRPRPNIRLAGEYPSLPLSSHAPRPRLHPNSQGHRRACQHLLLAVCLPSSACRDSPPDAASRATIYDTPAPGEFHGCPLVHTREDGLPCAVDVAAGGLPMRPREHAWVRGSAVWPADQREGAWPTRSGPRPEHQGRTTPERQRSRKENRRRGPAVSAGPACGGPPRCATVKRQCVKPAR